MGSVFMGEAKQNFQENEPITSPTDHVASHTVTHSDEVTVMPALCSLSVCAEGGLGQSGREIIGKGEQLIF